MSFVKNALLSLLVFSIVLFGFIDFMGELSNTYNTQPLTQLNDSNNTLILNQVKNMSNNIRGTMKPSQISSTQTSFLDYFTMGSGIIANTISLVFAGLPQMLYNVTIIVGNTIDLPKWATQSVLAAIGILITFASMKFILRRSP